MIDKDYLYILAIQLHVLRPMLVEEYSLMTDQHLQDQIELAMLLVHKSCSHHHYIYHQSHHQDSIN